jgi:hypothetical protein
MTGACSWLLMSIFDIKGKEEKKFLSHLFQLSTRRTINWNLKAVLIFVKNMKSLKAILLIFGLHQVYARSHGVRRDDICADVTSETLVIKDDVESCGTFIACVGQVAQRFKCFSDSVYSNGSAVCLSCDENREEYYEDEGGYGPKKTTKKKFTYKQTKRTKPNTKKYGGKPTRPPNSKSYGSSMGSSSATSPATSPVTMSEIESTEVNNFTISFDSKKLSLIACVIIWFCFFLLYSWYTYNS